MKRPAKDLSGTRVKPLSLGNHRHVEAAKGWCQLRSFNDANAELEQITAEHWIHPEALEVRWSIYANQGKWDGALDLADVISQMAPDEPRGYLYCATSLRELGRSPEALSVLLQAAKQFPREEAILYAIACLYYRSGRLDHARPWLRKALKAAARNMKQRPLSAEDLEPFW
jgi:tetratricopeptide (TPR) repeat protein